MWYKQLLIGAVANLGTIAVGMSMGFSAVALPAMQDPYHVPHVSEEQASWIASMISVGMPLGCLFIGPLLDRLGRRRTIILVNAPAVVGWFLIATVPSNEHWFFPQLYIGRFLAGVSVGLVSLPVIVYVSEVLDKNLRGFVITWGSLGVSTGILSVYILGSLIKDNWRVVAGICNVFPVLAIVMAWFLLPESPVWLALKERFQEAELSMRRIRGVPHTEDLDDVLREELDAMIDNIAQNHDITFMEMLAQLKRPEVYKPLAIFNSFFFFQQFSGIYVIILYSVIMVQEMGIQLDGYIITVLIGVCRVIMAVVTSYATGRFGRRILCNTSGIGMTLSLTALATYLSMVHDGTLQSSEGWFPATMMLLAVLTACLGFLSLPFAMIGEVFPPQVRSNACAATTFVATTFAFLAVKLFPDMRRVMGYHNLFTFYAAVSAIGTLLMYVYIPETQGKTLEEVEQMFKKPDKFVEQKR
ncbi:facilitated trehalose transporter Tret1-like isoform X2 [Periplaneta americana]|uniref:facilitated trehalose transporter Tret1-like isoform X2 n=1 Tax=Periplaneta americana TaxID=6978 RepID=UPI0037E734EC